MPNACTYISCRNKFWKLYPLCIYKKLPAVSVGSCAIFKAICRRLQVLQYVVEQVSLHGHVEIGLKDASVLADDHTEGYS